MNRALTNHPRQSLQDILDTKPDIVDYFYHETASPYFLARIHALAKFIPTEHTNWRDEQRAWRDTAILFDVSHHMPEMFLSGPDTLPLLSRIAVNNFSNFEPGKAKHLLACTPSGYVIGDCIVYCLGKDEVEIVAGMPVLNWLEYHAQAGRYDVTVRRENVTPLNPTGQRTRYRFQLDGPAAEKIFAEVVEGEVPEIGSFRTGHVKIRGRDVQTLGHGMAGHKGVEISGPFEDMAPVIDAVIESGRAHGLKRGGLLSYYSTAFESGYLAQPLPAIYTGEALREYREWLPASSWEANPHFAGSFQSKDITDYYTTPWELGYNRLIKFDHDFVGRTALETMGQQKHRKKMTLVWNKDDVMKVLQSQFGSGPRYKAIEFPTAFYGFVQTDEVRDMSGNQAGVSCRCGYSNNEGAMLSICLLDEEHAVPGRELVLTWGEPNGGSRKPNVERHEQTSIRVLVAPAPYAEAVRKSKVA